ncbi:hypothetical protein B9Z19DRAFT_1078785 [Tuber borchii]|uniref:Secreted protein n=1 Tax=Tuber borchii TaxID=42251 RepID=A0A2T6ZYX3_TUBBO|nr:hypothetical protein B9Z19DRAFT_1078785 [Tuber borchii]
MPRTSVKKTFLFFLFLLLLPHSEETLSSAEATYLCLQGNFFLFTLFPNEWVAQAAPIINAQRSSIWFYCSTGIPQWPKAQKCPLASTRTVPWRRRWDPKIKTEVAASVTPSSGGPEL